MKGVVQGREAVVTLTVHTGDRSIQRIEFVVDTAFDGFFMLPEAEVASLALPFDHITLLEVADGEVVPAAVHIAEILWHSHVEETEVIASGRSNLVGMSRLAGNSIYIEAVEGGELSIDQLE